MYFVLQPDYIAQWLQQELVDQRKVFKEFEIISHWKKKRWLPPQCLATSLSLFRTHFFIFHQLYHFHQELQRSQRGSLGIHALCVRFNASTRTLVRPTKSKNTALAPLESLQQYYLDWRPLFETSLEDVQKLLEFAHAGVSQPYRLQEATKRFQLTLPTNRGQIKDAYRRLVTLHHPDKGGAIEKIQLINEDRALLLNWLDHQDIPSRVL